MVTDFDSQNTDKPMNNLLAEILDTNGGSIASFGGSLAVVLAFVGSLGDWVVICGGALGLCGGALGVVSKLQEIRFKSMQYNEFLKSIERDAELYESAKKASERSAIIRELRSENK